MSLFQTPMYSITEESLCLLLLLVIPREPGKFMLALTLKPPTALPVRFGGPRATLRPASRPTKTWPRTRAGEDETAGEVTRFPLPN